MYCSKKTTSKDVTSTNMLEIQENINEVKGNVIDKPIKFPEVGEVFRAQIDYKF